MGAIQIFKHRVSSLETVEQSLCDAADGTEGGAVGEWLWEIFAFLYAAAEQRIQGHRTWNGEDECWLPSLCIIQITPPQ